MNLQKQMREILHSYSLCTVLAEIQNHLQYKWELLDGLDRHAEKLAVAKFLTQLEMFCEKCDFPEDS